MTVMKAGMIRAAGFLLSASLALGQEHPVERKFPLFRMDPSCACIKTKKVTKTVRAAEIRAGKPAHQIAYQVFYPISNRDRQLFRIQIGGDYGGQFVKLWNYGIADEADFNGDGSPDYSWYGGDDTTSEMYIFLSSGNEYKRVDVTKTIEAAWQRRFSTRAPNFEDSESEYGLEGVQLVRNADHLALIASVDLLATDGSEKKSYRFIIGDADFKP